MRKKIVLVAVLIMLIVSLQGPEARAGILAPWEPGYDYPRISIVARESIDNGNMGKPDESLNQYGMVSWNFAPPSISYSPVEGEEATASISTSGSYTDSLFQASGSGAASSNYSEKASSGFTVMFRPSVDCTFHLVVSLAGDIYQAGDWVSGLFSFVGQVPGSGSNPVPVFPYAQLEGLTLDESGLLYAGTDYTLHIEVLENHEYYYKDIPNYSGNWNFDLTVQAATAQAVPVPPSLLLLGTGLLGLGATGLRRRRRS